MNTQIWEVIAEEDAEGTFEFGRAVMGFDDKNGTGGKRHDVMLQTMTNKGGTTPWEDQDMDGSPFQLYEQLSITYPSLLQPLIHERDTYLAWSLKRSKAVNNSKRVVGVIGKSHMNGVVYALITDQGNLRFRDLVGRTSGDRSNGWIRTILKNLFRDTILTVILWALYEQLMSKL